MGTKGKRRDGDERVINDGDRDERGNAKWRRKSEESWKKRRITWKVESENGTKGMGLIKMKMINSRMTFASQAPSS